MDLAYPLLAKGYGKPPVGRLSQWCKTQDSCTGAMDLQGVWANFRNLAAARARMRPGRTLRQLQKTAVRAP